MSDQNPPPPPPPQEPNYAATPASSSYGAGQDPYGQSPYVQTPYAGGAPAQKPAVLSIISLVLGILGIVGAFVVVLPIFGSIMQLFIPAGAVVLGFLGKAKEPWAPKGLWLTGIILGFVGLAIAIISLILWIVAIASYGSFSTGGDFSTYP
jgi:hypothetical protein